MSTGAPTTDAPAAGSPSLLDRDVYGLLALVAALLLVILALCVLVCRLRRASSHHNDATAKQQDVNSPLIIHSPRGAYGTAAPFPSNRGLGLPSNRDPSPAQLAALELEHIDIDVRDGKRVLNLAVGNMELALTTGQFTLVSTESPVSTYFVVPTHPRFPNPRTYVTKVRPDQVRDATAFWAALARGDEAPERDGMWRANPAGCTWLGRFTATSLDSARLTFGDGDPIYFTSSRAVPLSSVSPSEFQPECIVDMFRDLAAAVVALRSFKLRYGAFAVGRGLTEFVGVVQGHTRQPYLQLMIPALLERAEHPLACDMFFVSVLLNQWLDTDPLAPSSQALQCGAHCLRLQAWGNWCRAAASRRDDREDQLFAVNWRNQTDQRAVRLVLLQQVLKMIAEQAQQVNDVAVFLFVRGYSKLIAAEVLPRGDDGPASSSNLFARESVTAVGGVDARTPSRAMLGGLSWLYATAFSASLIRAMHGEVVRPWTAALRLESAIRDRLHAFQTQFSEVDLGGGDRLFNAGECDLGMLLESASRQTLTRDYVALFLDAVNTMPDSSGRRIRNFRRHIFDRTFRADQMQPGDVLVLTCDAVGQPLPRRRCVVYLGVVDTTPDNAAAPSVLTFDSGASDAIANVRSCLASRDPLKSILPTLVDAERSIDDLESVTRAHEGLNRLVVHRLPAQAFPLIFYRLNPVDDAADVGGRSGAASAVSEGTFAP